MTNSESNNNADSNSESKEEIPKKQEKQTEQVKQKPRVVRDDLDPEDIELARKEYGDAFDQADEIQQGWMVINALMKRMSDSDKEEPKKQTKKEPEQKSFWRKLLDSSVDDDAPSFGPYAKQCNSCFTKNPQNSQFCNKCGKKLY